ncbi:MAG TPA: cytochrome c, partial [Polyangiaceae bacterium]|nr:cytochrome c [Polyangiaceae bacterium]
GALVAFLLTQSIAVADGATVGRYRAPQFSTLIGGGGYGAGLVGSEPYVFDPSSLSARSYGLLSVKHIALGLDGWLYAATPRAIYVGAPGGDLSLAYDAQSNTIHQIVTSRDAVWFTEGRELGVVTKDRVLETRTQPVAPDTVLLPTASSDIWALAGGSLQRFSNIVAAPDRAAAWATAIGPIFAHSCAECHVPNGVSGIDLSTVEAWESDRSAIRERVIETRTMPPQGHELSPAERAAIGAWLGPVP